MSQIKLLIVDDHPVFRGGLRDALETEEGIHVVATASDGEEAIQKAHEHRPDVIFMDINLPTMNGLQVTQKIKTQLPETKVIMITGYDDAGQVFHAFRAGASAYCPKDTHPDLLRTTVYAVHEGKYVFNDTQMDYDEVVAWMEEKLGRGALTENMDSLYVPLSPREMEILESVTKGLSNKEIAYTLGISHQTVKNHMTAILRKLRVEDRTQAAVYAIQHGWVRLEHPKG